MPKKCLSGGGKIWAIMPKNCLSGGRVFSTCWSAFKDTIILGQFAEKLQEGGTRYGVVPLAQLRPIHVPVYMQIEPPGKQNHQRE